MPQSDDERRAKNREKQRRYREKQRELKAAATATTSNAGDIPTTQRDAVEESLAAMKWLVSSDNAAVAQARMLAQDVDELRHAGNINAYLSAQSRLTTVLDRLGGTPVVRQQHELRSRKLTPSEASDGGDGSPSRAATGNVSQFERPKKRRAS